jgi:hypothetical protein
VHAKITRDPSSTFRGSTSRIQTFNFPCSNVQLPAFKHQTLNFLCSKACLCPCTPCKWLLSFFMCFFSVLFFRQRPSPILSTLESACVTPASAHVHQPLCVPPASARAPQPLHMHPSLCTHTPASACMSRPLHVCPGPCTHTPASAHASQPLHVCPSLCTRVPAFAHMSQPLHMRPGLCSHAPASASTLPAA